MDQNTKPFYKNQRDMLEEVGITPRQLSHWQNKGLFSPELNDPKRVYTERDIHLLRTLRRLIVELGFSIAAVQAMVGERSTLRSEAPLLDLSSGQLVTREELLMSASISVTGNELDEWIRRLALRRFLEFRRECSGRPGVYRESRDDLLERVKKMDLYARTYYVPEGWDEDDDSPEQWGYAPSFEDDPAPWSPDQSEQIMYQVDRAAKSIRSQLPR